jgi:hypothetical protein
VALSFAVLLAVYAFNRYHRRQLGVY